MNHFPINTEKAAECSGAQLVSWNIGLFCLALKDTFV